MAGNSKSGRKSSMEEFKDGCLLTMTTSWLLNNFQSFTKEEKMKVALSIAPKGIVQKLEHSGNVTWEGLINEFNEVKARNHRSMQSITN